MATKTDQKEQQEESFESAMEKLENLVEAMEEEKLPLDRLLVSYEDGIRLAKYCSGKLIEAEKRIEIITRKASGETIVEAFDPESPTKSPTAAPLSSQRPTRQAPEDISLF